YHFFAYIPSYSSPQPSIHRLRHLPPNPLRLRTRPHMKCPPIHLRRLITFAQRRMHTLLRKQPRQLPLHCFTNGMPILGRKTMQHQLLNMHFDVIRLLSTHTQPPISASVSDFSNLAYSLRAARNRWDMRTGSPASAARN